jgi:hypothetical protein
MRIRLSDLAPGVNYAVQIRATDGARVSDWSRVFNLLTTSDSTAPKVPTGVTGSMTGSSFNLAWAAVTLSTDNSAALDLDRYEVKVESTGTATTGIYTVKNETKFTFTLEMNRALFGTPRAQITMSVQAVDATGNTAGFSSTVSQTNPAPANVTGLTGAASVDTITLKWTANTDPDLVGYQVWRSKTGAAGTYSLLWAGAGTQYADSTTDYFTDHWYRVYAVDDFGTLSVTPAQTGAALRPNGTFTVDTTAPPTPTGLAATLTNATDGKSAKAVVTWTAVTDTDGDLAEYIIDYRAAGETNWNTAKVDYEKTALTISALLPYTNHDFRIRSSDWSANLSGWSSTVTATASTNAAPATVTGVVLTAGRDSLTAYWNENSEPDVAYGAGVYTVEFATNSSFSAGNLTYRTGASQITVTGIPPATAYWVRVKAVDSLGLSSAAWSATTGTTTVSTGIAPSTFKYWPPSSTAPSSPSTGDLWMDTSTGFEKQYNGSVWVNTGNVSLAYTSTKGTDLVTNGNAQMRNNYNFPGTTYDGIDYPVGTSGSFNAAPNVTNYPITQEYFTIDPSRRYTASAWVKQKGLSTDATCYVRMYYYTSWNNLEIGLQNITTVGSVSTLTAALSSGQSTISVDTTAGWNPGPTAIFYKWIGVWPFVDPNGKTWQPGTYTENFIGGQGAYTSITSTTVTLATPYSGPTLPIGTKITNQSGGDSANLGIANNITPTSTWTKYSRELLATDYPPAATRGRMSLLSNLGGTITNSTQSWAGVSVSEVVSAQATADGKNKIVRSTSDASGTTGYVTNDLWWKLDGSGNVIAQWKFNGTIWVSELLMDGVFGSLSANKLVANSAFVTTLNVGTGGVIQSAGYTGGGTSGFQLSTSGLTIKGTGNVVDAGVLKGGIITGTTINVGVGGVLNVDSTGKIQSNNFSNLSTGYLLDSSGLQVNDGSIDAKALRAGSAIIGDLTIGRSADSLGEIKSFGYVANSTGFRLHKTGLEINNGVIKAGALQIQSSPNIIPPYSASFEFAPSYYVGTIAVNGPGAAGSSATIVAGNQRFGGQSLQLIHASGAGYVDYVLSYTAFDVPLSPSTTYLASVWAKTTNAAGADLRLILSSPERYVYFTPTNTITFGANNVWQRFVGNITTTSTETQMNFIMRTFTPGTYYIDGIQMEEQISGSTTPSAWTPPGMTSADGGIIRTGEVRSNTTINVSGIDLPAWSINTAGNMQIGDGLIRGKLVVGTTSEAPVNLAPNNGDFEVNTTGYSVYTVGGTGTGMFRTTTTGEILDGTASGKVIAAAGAKTALGVAFALPATYQPGTTVTVSAKMFTNTTDSGSTFRVSYVNSSGTVIYYEDAILNPTLNKSYSLSSSHIIDTGENVASIYLAHTGTLTSTMVLMDSIVVNSDNLVNNSYVSSPDYTRGLSGWRIFSNGSVEFNNGIFRGTLGANMITGENFAGTVFIGNTFVAGDAASRHVELSPAGVQLYETDGSTIIDLPTDVTKPASFSGDLLASSLTVADQMAIRGSVNELSKGATLTIASGTTAPSSPPTVSVGWQTIVKPDKSPTYDPYKYGLAYDPTWAGGTGAFITAQSVYGTNANIDRMSKVDGSYFPGSSIGCSRVRIPLGGVTVITPASGTYTGIAIAYVLGTDINGAWYIEGRRLDTGAKVYEFAYNNATSRYNPTIGNDGTNLLVAFMRTADRMSMVQTVNPTTGAGISIFTTNYAMGAGNNDLSYVGISNYDYGASRLLIARRTWTNVYTYSATGVRTTGSSAVDFSSGGNITGLTYANVDGTGNAFWSFDANAGKFFRHSGWLATTQVTNDSTLWVGNTWYDSNATGGTHETQVGPLKKVTVNRRQGIVVTVPPLPIRPLPNTTDDAVAAVVYMAKGATTPTAATLDRQGSYVGVVDGNRTTYYGYSSGADISVPSAGAAPGAGETPPTTNGFAGLSGTAALFRSSNDRFNLYGDGSGVWSDLVVNSAGVLTISNRLFGKYATGTYTAPNLAAAATGSVNISFPFTFASVPKVFNADGQIRLSTSITAITTTGCTINFANYSGSATSGTAPGYWMAVLE